MITSTDASSLVTLYDYDARGRLIKTMFDDGRFTTDEYDIHGRVKFPSTGRKR